MIVIKPSIFCTFLTVVCAVSAVTGCYRLGSLQFGHRQAAPQVTNQPQQPVNYYRSPHFARGLIRKVVIVAPLAQQGSFREQEKFTGHFAQQLRAQGLFDAVVNRDVVDCNANMITSGKFDERIIVQLGRKYSADAVLFTQLNSFSAYAPMNAAASFALVDIRESVVLMAADGTWDSREPGVRVDFNNFIDLRHRFGTHQAPLAYQQSPDEFLAYVATRMAHHIQSVR